MVTHWTWTAISWMEVLCLFDPTPIPDLLPTPTLWLVTLLCVTSHFATVVITTATAKTDTCGKQAAVTVDLCGGFSDEDELTGCVATSRTSSSPGMSSMLVLLAKASEYCEQPGSLMWNKDGKANTEKKKKKAVLWRRRCHEKWINFHLMDLGGQIKWPAVSQNRWIQCLCVCAGSRNGHYIGLSIPVRI